MYFLAQLPDEGECTNYVQALGLLAPPIVHQARAEGRRVHRQGDIFAIETDLTNDYFKDAKIARREQVFSTTGPAGDKDLKVQRRSKRCKTLMIYGTGHTSNVVAVKPNGSTFIRGFLFHDPVLERKGRAREHQNVDLVTNKWHLCVRNSVPRAVKTEKEKQDVSSSNASKVKDQV